MVSCLKSNGSLLSYTSSILETFDPFYYNFFWFVRFVYSSTYENRFKKLLLNQYVKFEAKKIVY